MQRRSPWPLSAGPRSALLTFAAVLALLGAAACDGGSDDLTDAAAPDDGEAAVTEVVTEPGLAVGHSIGNLAPDFTVETVAGETFALSEATVAGSPVLLYFFTTW